MLLLCNKDALFDETQLLIFADSSGRLKNVLVSVAKSVDEVGFGEKNSASQCSYKSGQAGGLRCFQCSQPMFGRYVRVTGVDQNAALNIHEIEVNGWF